MKVALYKVKKEKFDELRKSISEETEAKGSLCISEEVVKSNSEPVLIEGKEIILELDIDKYLNIARDTSFGYIKFAKIGMELHKDFCSDELHIPRNLFYEKELWAYLSLTCFKDVVKELRLRDDKNLTESKIKQFYFNAGEISRTGLLFLWVMVDRLNSANDFETTLTAFEFVDPVKAILERTMGKNPNILRAFVRGIINNERNSKFKSDKYRSRVPSHISCYASVNVLDALDYEELVDIITEQQRVIISEI